MTFRISHGMRGLMVISIIAILPCTLALPAQEKAADSLLSKRALVLDCTGQINAANLPAGFTPASFDNSLTNFCSASNAGCECNAAAEVECNVPPGNSELFFSAAAQDCFNQCECPDLQPATPDITDVEPGSVGQCTTSSCSNFSGCDSGCNCQINDLSAGSFFFSGGCTSDPLKKRDEGQLVACPCNGTYISEACCETPSGIVYEPPEKKLGEIFPEER
ncbi:MAG: hypothetical protein M1817_005396 [Caeruleum heppii]|nr:MAG: hypothetical protein M1817_005396 [Caeruleum heppii]